jgi:hypothetical protein
MVLAFVPGNSVLIVMVNFLFEGLIGMAFPKCFFGFRRCFFLTNYRMMHNIISSFSGYSGQGSALVL